MPYTHAIFSDLKSALDSRLGDAGRVYWTDVNTPLSELNLLLYESLRVFSALTGYYRSRAKFSTTAGSALYDLTAQSTFATPLAETVQDREVVASLEYHLIEPYAVTGGWTGSEQFTIDDLAKAVQRRRNQFLADSGLVLTRNSALAATSPPDGRVQLPDSVISIHRAAWVDSTTGYVTPLYPSDEWAATAQSAGLWWLTPDTPYSYSILASPPLTLQLIPPPLSSGSLDLLYVATGAAVDLTTGVVLGIPDDYAWVVKWGALADLLYREGPAYDPIRARFCESRYKLGVSLAKLSGLVLATEINGVPVIPTPLADLDACYPNWQSVQKPPTDVGVAGEWVAVSPVPDGIYSITADVIGKFPIPATDGAYVEIGREHVDFILDYASHLAAFKLGGAEFDATVSQADHLIRGAVALNNRISAAALFNEPMRRSSLDNLARRPFEVEGVGAGVLANTLRTATTAGGEQ